MAPIKAVTVFGGAASGQDPAYRQAALALGEGLAQAGITLIYGGGGIGIMGAVADGALGAGGEVIGIIPDFLARREVAHRGVGEMIVTDSMHARKSRMFEMSDAFVTLPGGLGTLDETFEMLTWRQLSLHDKPILICNIGGWATPLISLIATLIGQGFALNSARDLYEVVADTDAVLERLTRLPAGDQAVATERL
jgi:uncharacterized protein (TIGR00730 family)